MIFRFLNLRSEDYRNKDAAREEHWQAARRAEALYRQIGDADRLGHALLGVATIAATRDEMSASERALREAETLIAAGAPPRKQAALAGTQGTYELRRGAPQCAIAAFQRRLDLYRSAGDLLGENAALGDVGTAQLAAGDVDAAVESLRKSVDGLRAINAPYGLDFRLNTLVAALAWRGDGFDIVPLARDAFDHHRPLGATSTPLLAVALQHARRHDAERAVMLVGYARSKLPYPESPTVITLPLQQCVRDLAAAKHPATAINAWLRAGECLTEEQAAAIAFDDAPLHGVGTHS